MNYRPNVPAMDDRLGKEIRVLDHGFIRLIDYMGDDAAIVQAARVSYGAGTKTVREDAKLIHYLWQHRHTSPFEMCEIKLHCKMPIFVARQWVRHRTASINEYSARYSVLDAEFYVPEQFKAQDTKNRQGSAEAFVGIKNSDMQDDLRYHCLASYKKYEALLDQGVSRELARMVLPVNFYTQWYWKIDLHNLLHFLTLRCDEHAQWEIRQYANVIADIVADWVPVTHAAWKGNQA